MQIDDQITGPIFRRAEKVHCSRDTGHKNATVRRRKITSTRTCSTSTGLFHLMISNKVTRKGECRYSV